MPDETSDGGLDLMRIIVNLGGVMLVGGLVVLVVATILVGLGYRMLAAHVMAGTFSRRSALLRRHSLTLLL